MDSKGNVYLGDLIGKRVQKFIRGIRTFVTNE
jgi:hypothetical protein